MDGWLSDARCKNEDPGLGDEGFSESVPIQPLPRCHQRALSDLPTLPKIVSQRRNSTSKIEVSRDSTSENEVSRSLSPKVEVLQSDSKVFQQLRVALEKLPAKKLPILMTSSPSSSSSPSCYETKTSNAIVAGSKRVAAKEEKSGVDKDLVKKIKLDVPESGADVDLKLNKLDSPSNESHICRSTLNQVFYLNHCFSIVLWSESKSFIRQLHEINKKL